MVRKLKRTLTKEQRERGVIFSSALSISKEGDDDCTTHEILISMARDERELMRKRLLDDSFFNESPFNYNIIRE
jgi:hypothetical protein